jgi:hypothetical protein
MGKTKEEKVKPSNSGEFWYIKRLSHLKSYFAWFIMRAFGIECTFEEVQRGCYNPHDKDGNVLVYEKIALDDDKIESPEDILELCKETYEEENKRLTAINEKCKVLLTISTILLTLISLSMTRMIHCIYFTFPLFFVFLTIFMLLVYFDVGCYSRPLVNDDLAQHESKKLKCKLAKDYLSCISHNGKVCDFLVDVYRVAKNSLLVGLVLLSFIVIAYSLLSGDKQQATSKDDIRKVYCPSSITVEQSK